MNRSATSPHGDVIPPPVTLHDRPSVAVVLAAGRSSRLRERTGERSKATVQLGGFSLLERCVRSLLRYGIERVVVVVGHDAAGVEACLPGELGEHLTVLRAPE